jgi:fatty-acyl-CoA synthase
VPVGTADLSSLRFIGGGGSAIPVAVGNALQENTEFLSSKSMG